MNRRQFTQSLAALVATPALPVKAMALPTASVSQPPYSWAAFIARVHDKASPAMFKRQLGLSDEMAQSVFDTLIREQIITRPNASGISQTVAPFKRSVDQMIRFQATTKPAASSTTHQSLGDDSTSVNQRLAKQMDDSICPNTTDTSAQPVLPDECPRPDQLDQTDPIAPRGARDLSKTDT